MPADHRARPTISSTQLMSSALAAVTAAIVGSRLGIAGTLVGAAAGSVIGTIGTAMYGHWLDRTASHVRTVVVRVPASVRSTPADPTAVLDTVDDTVDDTVAEPAETTGLAPASTLRQPTWRTVGLAVVATFAVAIGSITAFEAIAGQPVSTLTGGDAGSGTTLGRAVDPDAGATVIQPDPDPDPAPTPATPVPTETATTPDPPPSATPTATPTPTPTPTDSPTVTPTTPGPTTPSAAPTTPRG